MVRKFNHVKFQPREITFRNYRHYDANTVKNEIGNKNWEPFYSSDNVNFCWEYMKGILLNVFDKAAPLQKKRVKGKKVPWITVEITQKMNCRDQLLRRYRKTNDPAIREQYKRQRNDVNKLVKRAKAEYHRKVLQDNAGNPDKFWAAIKEIYPTKANTVNRRV